MREVDTAQEGQGAREDSPSLGTSTRRYPAGVDAGRDARLSDVCWEGECNDMTGGQRLCRERRRRKEAEAELERCRAQNRSLMKALEDAKGDSNVKRIGR